MVILDSVYASFPDTLILQCAGVFAQQTGGVNPATGRAAGHGDVVQRVAYNGTTSPRYDYDAFGNQKDGLETDPNPFRYCGEYFDGETGDVYLRARYYNTSTGRFTSEDPIRSGKNWYLYGNDNPVNFSDPLGLDAIVINKPLEEAKISWTGEEHMSIILQNAAGTWFYVSYLGDSVKYQEIGDPSVLTNLESMNEYFKEHGIIESHWKDFTRGVYVEGDFSASLRQAEEWRDNPLLVEGKIDLS